MSKNKTLLDMFGPVMKTKGEVKQLHVEVDQKLYDEAKDILRARGIKIKEFIELAFLRLQYDDASQRRSK